ncbi:MAG: hypothetical protein Q4E37_03755 [Tissierellia bacterium]|nr:hypothetical protein [Tissierellia bacterium]
MIIGLDQYNALVEFFDQLNPAIADAIVLSCQTDYDFVLEAMNIRQRGEVEWDYDFSQEDLEKYRALAQEELAAFEGEEEDYLSHIDLALIKTYSLVVDFFNQLEKAKK